MLKIRSEQMQTLNDQAYSKRLRELMKKCWPDQCQELGEEKLAERLKLGIQKAEDYGFRDQNYSTRFIHLIFLLNMEDFDVSPETPWAKQVLGWEDASDVLKLAALEKYAQEYIEKKAP